MDKKKDMRSIKDIKARNEREMNNRKEKMNYNNYY